MSDVAPPGVPTAASIVVPRHARYFTLGPSGADEVWLVLHGYGQLAGYFVRHFAPLAEAGALVVAPEALNRFYLHAPQARAAGAPQRVGATWMTREDREREIADYVAYLDAVVDAALLGAAPGAVLRVLGFSQGGTTACRWVARGRHRPSALVLWAAQIPDDLELPRDLAGVGLTFVVGTDDEYVTPGAVEALGARLDAAGLPHDVQWYEGTHRLEADALARAVATARRHG